MSDFLSFCGEKFRTFRFRIGHERVYYGSEDDISSWADANEDLLIRQPYEKQKRVMFALPC